MSSRKVVAGTYLQGRSHRHRPPSTIAKPNPNPIPNPNPNQVVCFGLKDGTDLSSKLKRAQVTPTLTLTLTLTLTTDPHPNPNPNPNPNQAAQAFGIKTIHFVPFEAGVLECAATYLTNYHDYTH